MSIQTSPIELNNPDSVSKLEDKPLSFQTSPNGVIIPNQSLEKEQAYHSLKKTTGSEQPNLQKHLLVQATSATPSDASREKL